MLDNRGGGARVLDSRAPRAILVKREGRNRWTWASVKLRVFIATA